LPKIDQRKRERFGLLGNSVNDLLLNVPEVSEFQKNSTALRKRLFVTLLFGQI
jgi:hypothetical protein